MPNNNANAPEIPPYNEDVPLVEEIDNFEDPVEDPVHVELDRILLRMAEEDDNAPGIPPHDEDIPLMQEIYNFADFVEVPVLLEVEEEEAAALPADENMAVNMHNNGPDVLPLEFPPELYFQGPELEFADMRQEAAVVDAGYALAMAMVNEPQVFQAEDILQQFNVDAVPEPELPPAPAVDVEQSAPEEAATERKAELKNKRKRKAKVTKKAKKDNKKKKVADTNGQK